MEFNEIAIVRQCQKGDWSEFDKLYEFYLSKIYGFVYNRIRHKQTAEDVTSTVFTKAVENISSFRGHNSGFASWLYGIARNAVIDQYRKQKPTVEIESAADVALDDDFTADVDKEFLTLEMKNYLSRLSPREREVILMRIWDDLSHREIAEILGISEGNSKVIYSRAISNLSEVIL